VYKNFAKLTAYFGHAHRWAAERQEKRNSLPVQCHVSERRTAVMRNEAIRELPAAE
jgi:hypothetical protein